MSMSRDRVKFFLPYRYFMNGRGSNGMAVEVCQKILLAVFDMGVSESARMMVNHPNGFWIVCRPSQFARFIVRRHEWGDCINGIRDLKPEVIDDYKEKDWSEVLGDKIGITSRAVLRVAAALGYDEDSLPLCNSNLIDVAGRPHQRCYS